MIALSRATASRDQLQQLGCTIEWNEYPMEHSLALEEVRDIRAWLGRVLTAA